MSTFSRAARWQPGLPSVAPGPGAYDTCNSTFGSDHGGAVFGTAGLKEKPHQRATGTQDGSLALIWEPRRRSWAGCLPATVAEGLPGFSSAGRMQQDPSRNDGGNRRRLTHDQRVGTSLENWGIPNYEPSSPPRGRHIRGLSLDMQSMSWNPENASKALRHELSQGPGGAVLAKQRPDNSKNGAGSLIPALWSPLAAPEPQGLDKIENVLRRSKDASQTGSPVRSRRNTALTSSIERAGLPLGSQAGPSNMAGAGSATPCAEGVRALASRSGFLLQPPSAVPAAIPIPALTPVKDELRPSHKTHTYSLTQMGSGSGEASSGQRATSPHERASASAAAAVAGFLVTSHPHISASVPASPMRQGMMSPRGLMSPSKQGMMSPTKQGMMSPGKSPKPGEGARERGLAYAAQLAERRAKAREKRASNGVDGAFSPTMSLTGILATQSACNSPRKHGNTSAPYSPRNQPYSPRSTVPTATRANAPGRGSLDNMALRGGANASRIPIPAASLGGAGRGRTMAPRPSATGSTSSRAASVDSRAPARLGQTAPRNLNAQLEQAVNNLEQSQLLNMSHDELVAAVMELQHSLAAQESAMQSRLTSRDEEVESLQSELNKTVEALLQCQDNLLTSQQARQAAETAAEAAEESALAAEEAAQSALQRAAKAEEAILEAKRATTAAEGLLAAEKHHVLALEQQLADSLGEVSLALRDRDSSTIRLASIETDRQANNTRIAQLEKEVEELRAQLEVSSHTCNLLQQQFEDSQAANAELRSELEASKAREDQLLDDLAGYRTSIEIAKSELEAAAEAHQDSLCQLADKSSTIDNLSDAATAASEQAVQQQQLVKQLQSELAAARAKQDETIAQLQQQVAEAKEARGQVDEQLKERAGAVQQLESQLQAAVLAAQELQEAQDNNVSGAEQELASLRLQNDELVGQLKIANEETKRSEQESQVVNARIQQLQNHLAEALKLHEQAAEEAAKKANEVQEVQHKQLTAVQVLHGQAARQAADHAIQVQDLQGQLARAQKKQEQAVSKAQAVQQQLTALQQQHDSAAHRANTAEAQVETLRQQVESVRSMMHADSDTRAKGLQEQLTAADARADQAIAQANNMQQELAERAHTIEQASADVQTSKARIQELESDLEAAQKVQKEVAQQAQNSQLQVKELQQQLQTAHEVQQHSVDEAAADSKRLQELETQLATALASYEQAKSSNSDHNDRVKDLESKLDKANNTHAEALALVQGLQAQLKGAESKQQQAAEQASAQLSANQELQQQLVAAVAQHAAKESSIAELQKQLAVATQLNEQAAKEAANQAKFAEALQGKDAVAAQLQQEHAMKEAALQASRAQELTTQLAALQTQSSQQATSDASRIQELLQQLARLEGRHESATEQVKQLNNQLAAVQKLANLSDADAKTAELQQQLIAAQALQQQATQQATDSAAKAQDLQQQLARSQLLQEQATEKAVSNEQKMQQLQAQLDILQALHNKPESEHLKHVEDLQQQLAATQKLHEQAMKQAADNAARIQDLQQQLVSSAASQAKMQELQQEQLLATQRLHEQLSRQAETSDVRAHELHEQLAAAQKLIAADSDSRVPGLQQQLTVANDRYQQAVGQLQALQQQLSEARQSHEQAIHKASENEAQMNALQQQLSEAQKHDDHSSRRSLLMYEPITPHGSRDIIAQDGVTRRAPWDVQSLITPRESRDEMSVKGSSGKQLSAHELHMQEDAVMSAVPLAMRASSLESKGSAVYLEQQLSARDLEQKLADLAVQYAVAKQDAADSKSQVKKLQQQLAVQQAETAKKLQDLQQQLKVAVEQQEEQSSVNEAQIRELQEQLVAAESLVAADANTRVQTLQTQLTAANARNRDSISQMHTLQKQLMEAQHLHETAAAKAESAERHIRGLERQLSTASGLCEQTAQEAIVHLATTQALKDELLQSSLGVRLSVTVLDQNQLVEDLQNELAVSQRLLARTRQEAEGHAERAANLQDQVAEASQKLEQATQQGSQSAARQLVADELVRRMPVEADTKVAATQANLAALQNELSQIQQQHKQTVDRLAERNAEIEQLQAELVVSKQAHEEACVQARKLDSQLTELKQQLGAVEEQHAVAKEHVQQLQQQLQAANEKQQVLAKDVEESQANVQELQRKLDASQAAQQVTAEASSGKGKKKGSDVSKSQVEDLQKQLTAAKALQEEATKDALASKQHADALQQRLADAQALQESTALTAAENAAQLQQLQTQLATLLSEHEQAEIQVTEKRSQIKDLQQQESAAVELLKEQLASKAAAVLSLEERLESLRKESTAKVDTMAAQIQTLEQQLSQAETRHQEASKAAVVGAEKLVTLEKEVSALREASKASVDSSVVDDLSSKRVQELEQQLLRAEEEYGQVKQQALDSQAQLQAVQAQLSAAVAAQQQLQSTLCAEQTAHKNAQELVTELQTVRDKLQSDLDGITAEHQETVEQVAGLEAVQAQLRDEVQVAKREAATARTQLTEEKANVQKLQKQSKSRGKAKSSSAKDAVPVADADTHVEHPAQDFQPVQVTFVIHERLQQELDKQTEELLVLKAELEAARKQLEQERSIATATKDLLTTDAHVLPSRHEEVAELERQLGCLQSEHEVLQNAHAAVEKQLQQAQSAHSQMQSICEALQASHAAEVNNLCQSYEVQQANIFDRLKSELSEQQFDFAKLHAELDNKAQLLARATQAADNLQLEVVQLKKQLADAEQEAADKDAQLLKATEKARNAPAETARLREHLVTAQVQAACAEQLRQELADACKKVGDTEVESRLLRAQISRLKQAVESIKTASAAQPTTTADSRHAEALSTAAAGMLVLASEDLLRHPAAPKLGPRLPSSANKTSGAPSGVGSLSSRCAQVAVMDGYMGKNVQQIDECSEHTQSSTTPQAGSSMEATTDGGSRHHRHGATGKKLLQGTQSSRPTAGTAGQATCNVEGVCYAQIRQALRKPPPLDVKTRSLEHNQSGSVGDSPCQYPGTEFVVGVYDKQASVQNKDVNAASAQPLIPSSLIQAGQLSYAYVQHDRRSCNVSESGVFPHAVQLKPVRQVSLMKSASGRQASDKTETPTVTPTAMIVSDSTQQVMHLGSQPVLEKKAECSERSEHDWVISTKPEYERSGAAQEPSVTLKPAPAQHETKHVPDAVEVPATARTQTLLAVTADGELTRNVTAQGPSMDMKAGLTTVTSDANAVQQDFTEQVAAQPQVQGSVAPTIVDSAVPAGSAVPKAEPAAGIPAAAAVPQVDNTNEQTAPQSERSLAVSPNAKATTKSSRWQFWRSKTAPKQTEADKDTITVTAVVEAPSEGQSSPSQATTALDSQTAATEVPNNTVTQMVVADNNEIRPAANLSEQPATLDTAVVEAVGDEAPLDVASMIAASVEAERLALTHSNVQNHNASNNANGNTTDQVLEAWDAAWNRNSSCSSSARRSISRCSSVASPHDKPVPAVTTPICAAAAAASPRDLLVPCNSMGSSAAVTPRDRRLLRNGHGAAIASPRDKRLPTNGYAGVVASPHDRLLPTGGHGNNIASPRDIRLPTNSQITRNVSMSRREWFEDSTLDDYLFAGLIPVPDYVDPCPSPQALADLTVNNNASAMSICNQLTQLQLLLGAWAVRWGLQKRRETKESDDEASPSH